MKTFKKVKFLKDHHRATILAKRALTPSKSAFTLGFFFSNLRLAQIEHDERIHHRNIVVYRYAHRVLKAVMYEANGGEEESPSLFRGLVAHIKELSEEQIGDHLVELRTHPTTKVFPTPRRCACSLSYLLSASPTPVPTTVWCCYWLQASTATAELFSLLLPRFRLKILCGGPGFWVF